ncbi:MAG: polyprenyl synthetase family protein, partial [Phycisphaerales bacterium]|nr:polyprenyl synthetase family protein [Phycisphaerales bacterium]
LNEHLKSKHAAVNDVCQYLSKYRGKMLRPSLVLLSWRSVQDNSGVPESLHRAAGVVELIHLATLVHDDVLDEADIRRGGQTINSLWGNEGAVMLGDYLLSSAFHLCSTIRNTDLNILLGEVTNTLCAGELVQLYHRDDLRLELSEYYQIINDKTASLISASCKIGGILGGASELVVESLGVFGRSIGTAFQIRDDLIDIVLDEGSAGKPTGKDVAKGKMTLPSIVMLENDPSCLPELQKTLDSGDLCRLRKMLVNSSTIPVAQEKIQLLVKEAVNSIQAIRDTPAGKLLTNLARQLSKPV